MPLFLISRTDGDPFSGVPYDETRAVVIRAKSAEAALSYATGVTTEKDSDCWCGEYPEWSINEEHLCDLGKPRYAGFAMDGSNLAVEQIDPDGPTGQILEDFKAG